MSFPSGKNSYSQILSFGRYIADHAVGMKFAFAIAEMRVWGGDGTAQPSEQLMPNPGSILQGQSPAIGSRMVEKM